MKVNKLVSASLLISTFVLVSCGSNTYTIKFNYNHESNKGTYQEVQLKKDEVLNEPEEPNIEDFVFEGWYLDDKCSNPYLRFGLQVDNNFSLYAKWSNYNDLTQVEKIERFQKALAKYSFNTYRIVEEVEATIGYPGAVSGDDGVFHAHDKRDYHRYKDITTVDYYSVDGNNNETLYGKRHFYYDDKYFYNIYVDLEDSSQSEAPVTSKFKEDKIESFLSIDYVNINGGHEKNMIDCYNDEQLNEETFACQFDFNYTRLNKGLTSYTYKEAYLYAIYSESIGNYATYSFTLEYGLVIRDGLIRSSNIQSESFIAIGESEIMQYVLESKVTDYYYNSGEFAEFEGERLPK